MTKEEVIERVQNENVQLICLTFCDIFGNKKNITITSSELQRAFESGISLDASEIQGFQVDEKIDLLAKPDPDTVTVLPKVLTDEEDGQILHMFAEIYYPDGRPFENDGRYMLKTAVEKARKEGFSFNFGPAMEFYLMDNSLGEQNRVPVDHAGYMAAAPEDHCEMIRREISRNMLQMGLRPEVLYHEEGPGQNKIKFHFSDPVTAADAVISYKSIVKTVAAAHHLYADFSPKPIEKMRGNSMHVNMSVMAEDGEDRTPHIIAGILSHISEMTVFLNPTKKSYKRLGHDTAPKFISWSEANRSTLIRIPAYGGYTRFELRSPDNGTNPYIAFTLLIEACMSGIHEKPTLMRATETDLFTADIKNLPKLKALPLSHQEAVGAAKNSAFIQSILPEKLIKAYTSDK